MPGQSEAPKTVDSLFFGSQLSTKMDTFWGFCGSPTDARGRAHVYIYVKKYQIPSKSSINCDFLFNFVCVCV